MAELGIAWLCGGICPASVTLILVAVVYCFLQPHALQMRNSCFFLQPFERTYSNDAHTGALS